MLRAAFASLALLLLAGPLGATPRDEEQIQPIASIASIVELVPEPSVATEAAFGWLRFMAAGYRNSAELLGQGAAADAELAIGEAIEKAVRPLLDAQVGKKGKVKLSDTADGPVTKVDDSGVTITMNKADVLVGWADLDPKQIGLLLSKGKPTADGDVVAAAALKLLSGDAVDAKQRSTKLTSEIGKKLGELLADMKEVGPELKAARALDAALRDPDPKKAVERFKAAWPEAKATKLGEEAKTALSQQFIARGEEAFRGPDSLSAAIHAKVTTNPSKLHPDAGAGGMGLVLEYDFEKDNEGPDFDPTGVPNAVLGMVKTQGGGAPTSANPFKVAQSRLLPDGLSAGALPISFCADVEVELQGGFAETWRGEPVGFYLFGLISADGNDRVLIQNFSVIESTLGGAKGPSAEKKIEKPNPGVQVFTQFQMGNGKMTLLLNGAPTPPLNYAPSAPLRPFLLAGGPPTWFLERLVIKGTATGASLGKLSRLVAEREAKALFGE